MRVRERRASAGLIPTKLERPRFLTERTVIFFSWPSPD
jgi:hypothetical protein